MFFVFLVVAILAMIGLASVLGTSVAWVGALVFLPILLLKVFLVLMFFGFLGRSFRYWDGRTPPYWRNRRRAHQSEDRTTSAEDRFEEWHRMAHAREEVDSWVEDLPSEPE